MLASRKTIKTPVNAKNILFVLKFGKDVVFFLYKNWYKKRNNIIDKMLLNIKVFAKSGGEK